ncbi:RELT-like protein 2 isoform X1 [Stegostoma tigrinum]|uniref:RELT-like protein 2 isoform X1 n=1 Tax=Stegostoma tigrinum TaxID=3053191 RepID=UPI00202B587B|nr:RELT-like protein 2 isoform X1 [Stegostoma tigrinum]XP_048398959.1 RELT-like protein 2 isoform X1 [Stegostoma tigrinum]
MENHGEIEEATAHPQNLYTILLLVLVFFVMGLTGVLLCHILKEKGYHCRTSQEMDTEQEDTTSPEDIQEISKSNQDTVGQIVQCIIENEANVEALNELLREHEQVKPPVPSPIFPEPVVTKAPSLIPHHHTVHSVAAGSAGSACLSCNQRRKRSAMQMHRRAKETKSRNHGVEVTVLSVGRFRVTRVEKGQWAQELNRLPVIEACSGGHSVTTQTEPDYEKHMTHVSTANEGTEKESDPAQL